MAVTRTMITAAAVSVGLVERPVEVHGSLSSFGHVEGGADAVIDGLLDCGCTVVVPSFSTSIHQLPQSAVPARLRRRRNGHDVATDLGPGTTSKVPYDTDSVEVNRSEGAIVAAVARRPGRRRGDHPLNSFAAIGPLADVLIARQSPQDVYAPLRQAAKYDGAVVLMGTNLDKMTLLHAAEERAGRALFVRWAVGADGSLIEARVGSCSRGFERLSPHLAQYERRTRVGASAWRVFAASDVLAAAASAIRADPEITRCADSTCARCRDAIAGGPIT